MHVGSVATFVKDNGSFCDAHKSVGEGMGCLTAHPSGLFAYSDHSLPPKVFMVVYPQCDVRYTCEGRNTGSLNYRTVTKFATRLRCGGVHSNAHECFQ